MSPEEESITIEGIEVSILGELDAEDVVARLAVINRRIGELVQLARRVREACTHRKKNKQSTLLRLIHDSAACSACSIHTEG